MAEKKRTDEKKCTACGSEEVDHQGLSLSFGVGEELSETREHQFKCQKCDMIFWFVAERPWGD